MSQPENRLRFAVWQRSYQSEVNLAHCEAFLDQYDDLETQMLFDAWNAALATVPADNENKAGDAVAAQPKLVLALPDYEKRRILVASDRKNLPRKPLP